MPKKAKKVPTPTAPGFSKQVKVAEEPWREHPIWLFCCFDNALKFPDKRKERNHSFNELGDRLHQYEGMTWNQILNDGDRDHFININKLEKFARVRLAELNLDDEDHQEILRLRFNSHQRLWGYKEGDAFKILWWDPHHEVCLSHLRHT